MRSHCAVRQSRHLRAAGVEKPLRRVARRAEARDLSLQADRAHRGHPFGKSKARVSRQSSVEAKAGPPTGRPRSLARTESRWSARRRRASRRSSSQPRRPAFSRQITRSSAATELNSPGFISAASVFGFPLQIPPVRSRNSPTVVTA